jgi:NAD(P)-dependent dehydrogenase (short-subunit alcohol dehydrogenase family)
MASLRGKVVVITGGSSGIGRAAAERLAARGAHVVLAARRVDALRETARLCVESGGSAQIVPTDVTVEADVDALAEAALAETGSIDVWINNAGVTLFSKLDDAPFTEHRRVIETNLFGAILCARAVLPVFRRQRRGTLINVSSVLGKVGQPFVPSYVISKFGLRGLSETLRIDFADVPGVKICTLYPFAVDTPHFEAGANWLGVEALPVPPTQSADKVGAILARLAEHPRRERHVPRIALLGIALHAIAPRPTERLLQAVVREWHFSPAGKSTRHGNLFAPSDERPTVHGRAPKGSVFRLAAWTIRYLLGLAPTPRDPPVRVGT